MISKVYCYECKRDIDVDWNYDVFCLRLSWLDDFNHKEGFRAIDLGYSAVICPCCGREYQVEDEGNADGFGPYSSNNVIKEMGDSIFLLREYHELVQKYGKNNPTISYILS